jgi:hypothetical protein
MKHSEIALQRKCTCSDVRFMGCVLVDLGNHHRCKERRLDTLQRLSAMEAAPLSAIELQQLQESSHAQHDLDKVPMPLPYNFYTICFVTLNCMISCDFYTARVTGCPTIPFQISTWSWDLSGQIKNTTCCSAQWRPLAAVHYNWGSQEASGQPSDKWDTFTHSDCFSLSRAAQHSPVSSAIKERNSVAKVLGCNLQGWCPFPWAIFMSQ